MKAPDPIRTTAALAVAFGFGATACANDVLPPRTDIEGHAITDCDPEEEAPPESPDPPPSDIPGMDDPDPVEDPPEPPVADTGIWSPAPETSWQWQISGDVDTSFDVVMYDIDLFDVPQAVIDELHAAGRIVICYFSAGSHEEWRDDSGDFPREALGRPLDEWPGERWVDVRHPGVRAVMRSRLSLAAARGCDGVEPDNVDGYTNGSGFPLSGADQIDYNRFLAAEAHARGLSIGLKNDLDQVEELVGDFDWALNEECFAYDECELLQPFLDAGKAVFNVEYGGSGLADRICPRANAMNFDTLIKGWDLDAERISCR